jgi:cystathionine beta-lyase
MRAPMMPFDALTEAQLRARQSAKWRAYPPHVLPAWVAEMDYPLATPIKEALHEAIARDDAGYAFPGELGSAFATWARSHWGWALSPSDVFVAPDVVTAIAELLLVTTSLGDDVVIDPPVYPPFASTVRRLGRSLVETPLRRDDDGAYALDLDAIERAYAAGARVHILCSPHNPVGLVHPRETLERIAALADRYEVLVLSDEIHAPLTYPGVTHMPFTTVSPAASKRAIVLSSASKTWNLAGLKAALIVASDDATRAIVKRLPAELPYHAGHLGILAAQTAFAQGAPWRHETMAILERNRKLLLELLREHVPNASYRMPDAGYLAWIDCRALGLGADPAKTFLVEGHVALSQGPTFGPGGEGFARLNFATTQTLLEEAVRRMAIRR